MFKIRVLSVGKTKESWLDEGIHEYVKRLQPTATFEFVWAKNDAHLIQLSVGHLLICLDPAGAMMTSEQFASLLEAKLVQGGSRITFVIGGPEGLPPELKKDTLLSLSPMTTTHQIARLLILEQIYRAFEILKGSPYHK